MSPSPPTVLVLGATGMLGHQAVHVLGEQFEVHGTARDPERAAAHGLTAPLHRFDAARPEDLDGVLERSGAAVVLNCIGIVKQLEAASLPVPSIAVNSLFPHQVAAVCEARGIRLVHLSTDCVFSGELEPPARYGEDDVPDARDLYGRSKLLGEVTEGGALTLRTSIIGWELGRASGLLEWLASQAGTRVRGFAQAWFSGLTTRALSRVIAGVVCDAPDLRGLYHVAAEPISKYDLLVALDEALGLRCTVERVEEPRINRALDPSRFLKATGFEIPSWESMISEYAGDRAR